MTTPSDSVAPAPAPAIDVFADAEDFIEEASGQDDPPPLVTGTPKRLLGWIVPANFSVFMIWAPWADC